ncbi:MAG: hypothetical protein HY919_02935 [Elusimicrobia bacterium]|nr:hypothetical protein [Elusimicrobiota bacterium]
MSDEIPQEPPHKVFLEDIYNYFPRVSAIPAWKPNKFIESIAYDTTNNKLYVYNFITQAWDSFSGAAKSKFAIPFAVVVPNAAASSFIQSFNTPTDISMKIGAVVLTTAITVNKISFHSPSVGTTGTMDITVYDSEGNQKFTVTTANIVSGSGAAGVNSTVLASPITLDTGIYYVGFNTNSAATTASVSQWDSDEASGAAAESLDKGVVNEPKMQGTIAITSGTPPSSINPVSDIIWASNHTPYIRLDN